MSCTIKDIYDIVPFPCFMCSALLMWNDHDYSRTAPTFKQECEFCAEINLHLEQIEVQIVKCCDSLLMSCLVVGHWVFQCLKWSWVECPIGKSLGEEGIVGMEWHDPNIWHFNLSLNLRNGIKIMGFKRIITGSGFMLEQNRLVTTWVHYKRWGKAYL